MIIIFSLLTDDLNFLQWLFFIALIVLCIVLVYKNISLTNKLNRKEREAAELRRQLRENGDNTSIPQQQGNIPMTPPDAVQQVSVQQAVYAASTYQMPYTLRPVAPTTVNTAEVTADVRVQSLAPPVTEQAQQKAPAYTTVSASVSDAEKAPERKAEPIQTQDNRIFHGNQDVAPYVPPRKEAKPINTTNVFFILGALFIIISGLIFATTSWQFMADGVKAIVIFSFSALFFIASSLAERKFKLEKTGMLFYVLGSIFLPITFIAAGFFEFFGNWFSLLGDGRPLFLSVTFLLLAVVAVKGSTDYRDNAVARNIFTWAGLISVSVSICSLIFQFTEDLGIFALAASVYSLLVLLFSKKMRSTSSEKFNSILSNLDTFSGINTITLSLSGIAAVIIQLGKNDGFVAIIACIIFAATILLHAAVPSQYRKYSGGRNKSGDFFSWVGLIFLSLSVCTFISKFTDDISIFVLIASVYSLAMLFVCRQLAKIYSDSFDPIISHIKSFSVANTALLGAFGFIAGIKEVIECGAGFAAAGCVIFSITLIIHSVTSAKDNSDFRADGVGAAVIEWLGLIFLSVSFCFIIVDTTRILAIFSLAAAVFSLIVIAASLILTKVAAEKLGEFIYHLKNFSVLNHFILSISGLIAVTNVVYSERNICAFIACILFAVGYIFGHFRKKNELFGAIPFSIFTLSGLIAVICPEGLLDVGLILIGVALILLLLSFIKPIPEGLRKAFGNVSAVYGLLTGAISIPAVLIFEPSWVTFAAFIALCAVIVVIAFTKRENFAGRICFTVLPIFTTFPVISLAKLLFDLNTQAVFFLIALMFTGLQAVFVFLRKTKLRTAFSDIFYSAAAIITEFLLFIFSFLGSGYTGSVLFTIAGFLLTAATLFIPIFGSENANKRGIFASLSAVAFLPLIYPLREIFSSAVNFNSGLAAITVLIPLTAASVILTLISKKRDRQFRTEDFGISVSLKIIMAVYFFETLANEDIFRLTIVGIAAGYCIFRGLILRKHAEHVAGLTLIMLWAFVLYAVLTNRFLFSNALIFVAVAVAAVYFINLFINLNRDEKHEFYSLTEFSSRIDSVVILTLMMFAYMFKPDCLPGIDSAIPYFLIMLPFFFLCVIQAYVAKNMLTAILPSVLIFPVIAAAADGNDALAAILIWAAVIVSFIPGYFLHKENIGFAEGSRLYFDIFAFVRFIGAATILVVCTDEIALWSVCILAAVCILSLIREETSQKAKRILITAAAFCGMLTWQLQPFFELPKSIASEFVIIPILLMGIVIKKIYKEHGEVTSWINFVLYAGSYLFLFIEATASELISDGLIIVISSLALLLYSFAVKKRKWFILSATVLVVTTLFMSRQFWQSLAWWVYLLGAGILLIVIGAANEMKKKSDDPEALTRYMSEWKW